MTLARLLRRGLLYAALFGATASTASGGSDGPPAGLEPVGLRTEYRANPLGIDTPAPRLSWILRPVRPGARGQRQSAYQVLVATTPDALRQGRADLWDSGRVRSASPIHVVYGGRPLRSGQRVYWSVRVWDQDGRASPLSAPATWEMGLLGPTDWQGSWIARRTPEPRDEQAFYDENPAPLLRKAITVAEKPIRRARMYVAGLGYYELSLNGGKVGDHVLDPGWTDYAERVLYATYDVTDALRAGENVVGIALGNGWYNPLPLPMFGFLHLRETLPVGVPRALLQLRIEYADGTLQQVATDTSWRASGGPLLKNDIYLGEVYDARREQPGWDRPGFDSSGWEPVRAVAAPGGWLRAQDAPPIKVMRSIRPVRVTEPRPGVFIFDMGQNFAGWVTLRVRGDAGTRVTLRYGEALWPEGTLNVLTSTYGQVKDWTAISRRDWAMVDSGPSWSRGPYAPKTAWQSDSYILKGGGAEVYRPRFTWHGFRYVEVRGYPGRPALDALEGHLLHSSVETAGTFASSSALLNRIQEITLWSQLSNMFSVQSDCPHRERFGYGGDIVAASEMAIYNLDMARFYAKTVHDFADAQRPNGGFPEIAPDVGIAVEGLGGGAGPVGWGTAHPLLVWQLYQHYGDRRLLEEQYPNVRRWVELLRTKAAGGILDNGISDHESLTPKPVALTGTAFYHLNVRLAADMARVLGRRDEAAAYERLAGRIRAAFNARFLDEASGRYDIGTQATQAFALSLDLVPPARHDAVLGELARDLERHEYHVTTGIFGTKYLLEALTRAGRADLAYAAVSRRSFPGWGYMIENGATTLWESWAYPEHVASQNHPMFGSVSEWFYEGLLGIRPAPDAVGFDRIVIQPNVVGDLTWARGHHDSVRGRIGSAWRVDGDTFTLDVEIPVAATATVHVPTRRAEDVMEGRRPAGEADGVAFAGMSGGAAVYRIGSGRYTFTVRNFSRPSPAFTARP
jgi:alpha-L-rhamnosidase